MAVNITTFNHAQFGQIQTMIDEKGEPWFVGKSVASALGYANPSNALNVHVDKEDKTSYLIRVSGSNYKTKTSFINESGLYSLILSSKLDSARKFKRWVTSEVLPQIRQTGGFIPVHESDTAEDVKARTMEILQRTIETQSSLIEEMRPKVEYYNEVMQSMGTYTASDVASVVGMTTQKLNKLLCELKIQYGRRGKYALYADYLNKGLAVCNLNPYVRPDGTIGDLPMLRWTEYGLEFIVKIVKCRGNTEPIMPTIGYVQLSIPFVFDY